MKKLFYYDDGKRHFSNGEQIYINKVQERAEHHLHAHDFLEIAYVVSGTGIHTIGQNEYNVSKGDLFIINHDIPHEFRSLEDISEPRLFVYNCVFKPEFLDYRLVNTKDFRIIMESFLFRSLASKEGLSSQQVNFVKSSDKIIEDIYEKMFREFTLKEAGYIEVLRAYVIELIVTIFRIYSKNNSVNGPLEVKRREMIDKAINFMKDNFSKDLKLEDISTIAFLSPGYFSRLFKESTSMTISEYLQNLRIEEACAILKNTDLKIIDVAQEVGYKDLKFFNHLFKKITGKTPGQYRKSLG